uniref:Caspase-8 n=1 Tax=Acanthochromis polyacanthus TaxID=80966 RepID=A0A3Q1FMT9_9TELE
MDRRLLSRIDEELDSSEVAGLCFLCRDVISGKRLEGIKDAKQLFLRLEEKELLENKFFLTQLLRTIHRADLLSLIETDSRQTEETDARPLLSEYRVMLYRIYDDMTQENLNQFKFLLNNEQRRKMEMCSTVLDVFVEMEKVGLLSNTNLTELHEILLEIDQQLATTVQQYMQGMRPTFTQKHAHTQTLSICEISQMILLVAGVHQHQHSLPSVYSDAQSTTETPSLSDPVTYYYDLTHKPRGLCVVINNEDFPGTGLSSRKGTQEDAKTLNKVFTDFGFDVKIRNNLTASDMRAEMQKLGERNFMNDDALVVCVLSHGENECVYGTDEQPVLLRDLTLPFKSGRAPTLAGKPKLFFIQACQGSGYQEGAVPCPPTPAAEEVERTSHFEEDAGAVRSETVPWDADFLIGMATVPECKSFRNTLTGSIYIQELCRQLIKSAGSSEKDDILSVLTRVNREVSRGLYLNRKQMPQPKYTLTKKLVLKYV